MLNKICELSAEIGKATLILGNKDEQIKKMQEHIDAQAKQLNENAQQIRTLNEDRTKIRDELRGFKMFKHKSDSIADLDAQDKAGKR